MFTPSASPRRHAIRMASFVVLGLIRFANVQAATVCTSIAAQLKSALDDRVSQTQPYMIALMEGSHRSRTALDFALETPTPCLRGSGSAGVVRAVAWADPALALGARAADARARRSDNTAA